MIPLSVPELSGNEWKYIKECLDSGWVSSVGKFVERFENALAEYTDCRYSVAVVNGTSALHLSLLACGIQPDDEVIVPSLTFIAPVNTVRYCRAYPVFMDCDRDTLCIDVRKTEDFLFSECVRRSDGFTYNKKTGRRIKAVIPVHIFGHPANMEHLLDISIKYNITVIEDATESLGSEHKGKKTGSFGEAGCFSFNGNKIITTGGGGMVVTDNKDLADRMRHLSTQAKKDAITGDHDEVGYNYRLTNIQAAMGLAQMERLEEFIEIKRRNAVSYRDLLDGTSNVDFLWEQPPSKSNFWLYTIKVPREHRDALMKYLSEKKIQARPIWKLIHTLPMYAECQAYKIDEAYQAHGTCINLPSSVNIKREDLEYVAHCIKNYFHGT
ncbi:MAG: LegC family aminotransferase [Nitrospiraceae bacterium]|nr:MAG: LegC family aminotransferase [Nitrospiraceae bacterium]